MLKIEATDSNSMIIDIEGHSNRYLCTYLTDSEQVAFWGIVSSSLSTEGQSKLPPEDDDGNSLILDIEGHSNRYLRILQMLSTWLMSCSISLLYALFS